MAVQRINQVHVFFFNNCKNREHAKIYAEGAFYDLPPTEWHNNRACGMDPGQVCVALSWGSGKRLRFDWYSFELERRMAQNGDGLPNRVFFGKLLSSEAMAKSKALLDPRYATFFRHNGWIKLGPVFQGDVPAALVKATVRDLKTP